MKDFDEMLEEELQDKEFKEAFDEEKETISFDQMIKGVNMNYTEEQCIKETQEHIERVQLYLSKVIDGILKRGYEHDKSKMSQPELSGFVEFTPKLKQSTYGSSEYKENLKGMQSTLDHHYKNNSHHPEHYEDGINGMDLLDIVEMLCDWKAATERHQDGNILKSLEVNKGRFNIDDQLYNILKNTIKNLNFD